MAGFVRPNPCLGRSLSDRAYDVVWETAEELGVPIGIHEGSSVDVPTLGSDRPFSPLILHAVSHSFEAMLACAQLIAFGTLERHPGLRLLFLESSGGWAPFWLERLDEQAESFGGFCPDMQLRPSEYFARQCAISFEVDEHTLAALVPFVGERRIVWGSDYPHHDATFPGAVDAIRATVAPCSHRHPGARAGAQRAPPVRAPVAPRRAARPVRGLLHGGHGTGDRPRAGAVHRRRRLRERGRPAAGPRRHLRLLPRQDLHLRGLPARSADADLRGHPDGGRHRRPPRRRRPRGPRRVRDRRHPHHRAARARLRGGAAAA